MRALVNGDGAVIGGVCCLADITDAARMRSELEERANFDALTGCLNRSSVMTALSVLLADLGEETSAQQRGIAVVFVDFNRFKSVNDRFGHGVGDSLLVEVAGRLRETVRTGDVVGRLGGDEFLIVCPNVLDGDEATALGERVTAAITVAARDRGGPARTDRERRSGVVSGSSGDRCWRAHRRGRRGDVHRQARRPRPAGRGDQCARSEDRDRVRPTTLSSRPVTRPSAGWLSTTSSGGNGRANR